MNQFNASGLSFPKSLGELSTCFMSSSTNTVHYYQRSSKKSIWEWLKKTKLGINSNLPAKKYVVSDWCAHSSPENLCHLLLAFVFSVKTFRSATLPQSLKLLLIVRLQLQISQSRFPLPKLLPNLKLGKIKNERINMKFFRKKMDWPVLFSTFEFYLDI